MALALGTKNDLDLLRGQGVMLFLFDDLVGKLQGRTNVLGRNPVLLLNLLEGHPSGQAADDTRNGNPCPPNDGLPMLKPRVYHNPIVHDLPSRTGSQ